MIYLGIDDALDRVVGAWASDLVGANPSDLVLFERAAGACAKAQSAEIAAFVASERARRKLRVFSNLPPHPGRTIELLDGRVAVLLYDKAHLDEDDIAGASLLIFGKSLAPIVKRLGARTFVAPGKIGSEGGGSAMIDDEAGGVRVRIIDANGATTRTRSRSARSSRARSSRCNDPAMSDTEDRPAGSERVGIFGGSFNPPHVGHVLAAAYVLSTAPVDRVLVVPVHQHPFAKDLVAFADRLKMCVRAFSWLPGVRISTIERDLGGESFTLRTLERLAVDNPSWRMRLVVGSDVLPEVDKWHRFDLVERLAPPLVVARSKPGEATREGALPDVSSTRVRALFAEERYDAYFRFDCASEGAHFRARTRSLPRSGNGAVSARKGVAIVGAGKVGGALASAARAAGIVTDVFHHDDTRRFARRAGNATLVILAVPDRAIAVTGEALASTLGRPRTKPAFAHVSGRLGADELAGVRALGFPVAQMHPLASFVKGASPPLAGATLDRRRSFSRQAGAFVRKEDRDGPARAPQSFARALPCDSCARGEWHRRSPCRWDVAP